MPKIVIRQGRTEGQEYELEGEKFTMGRRKASDIPVADPKSSRNHAEIFKQGNHFYVRDLASRNGTFLNGERLAGDTQLSFGDKVSIGDTVMEFIGDSAGKPIDFEIPGYQIQERIGEGGMGVVYKARQVSMDRTVALKVLSEKYSSNSEFIDRFIREARSAGRLNHPNVIHVHDVSKAGGRYFFSMEFIDGPTVKKLLREKGRLPYRQSLEIITQAAKALEFAHENGIIHRDIKPDNIMLTSEGIVKIADLGIAKSFEEGTISPEGSGQRKVLGTPHYMAPEQALGKSIDRRADIYSLGASFYHMLTGKTPFKGSTITELLKAHVHEKLEPIQVLNSDVPEPVCFVVERMMAKSPEKRYDSMTRLLEDLTKAGQDRGDIERLAPEESSIMPRAAAAAARAKAQAEGPRVRGKAYNPTTNLIVMGAAILLVLGVLIGSYFVVQYVKRKRANRPDDTVVIPKPPDTPIVPEPERLLKEAEEYLSAGREDEARRRCDIIIDKFRESKEAKRALEIIGLIKTRQDKLLQAEINAAIQGAMKVMQDSPDDFGRQRDAWRVIRNNAKFEGTDAVEIANRKIKEIDDKEAKALSGQRGAAFSRAARTSDQLARSHDYVAAVEELTKFVALYPKDCQEVKTAQERIKEIEAHADKLLKDADDSSKRAMDGGDFKKAESVYADLKNQVKSAKWLKDIPGKIDGVKAAVKALFDEDVKGVMAEAKNGNLSEAQRRARSMERRFRGTAFEKDAGRMKTGLAGLPGLQAKIVAAINKGGPRKLEFKMEAPLFPGVTWRVTGATAEKLTLGAKKSGIPMESALPWRGLSPKDAYNVYLMYMPSPSKEEHLQLAFFCELRGLSKEAEEHRKKAQ